MKDIEKWIDNLFENTIPDAVVAIAFNLYEDGEKQWSIEMIGSNTFDIEDSDWACEEVFDTRDNILSWIQNATWEEILQETISKIQKYIEVGKYAERIKSYVGVGVGFVDGDITIVYKK